MPLPLPDLDNRRWHDLVAEGVALVPRYSPAWTDHNLHDPGVTLIELFAWLVEQGIYRANRIPDRHRLKFLSLVGSTPHPPRPAHVLVGATLAAGSGPLDVPAGLVFQATSPGRTPLPFTLLAPATLVEGTLAALQVHDGNRWLDRTPALRDHAPILPFGSAPRPPDGADGPALYLGFDVPWPVDREVALGFAFDGGDAGERERLLAELAARAEECAPDTRPCAPSRRPRGRWCDAEEVSGNDGPGGSGAGGSASGGEAGAGGSGAGGGGGAGGFGVWHELPPHHSVRLAWEVLTATGWRPLDVAAGEVTDNTRSLTLDGGVRLRLPEPTVAAAVGVVASPLHWVRCRIARGRYDEAPRLRTVVLNPLYLRQEAPALGRFTIAAGVTPSGAIAGGDRRALDIQLDATGTITSLELAPPSSTAPELLVVEYQAAGGATEGTIVLDVRPALTGSGLPEQHTFLRNAPVSYGEVAVHSLEGTEWRAWTGRLDLDASAPTDLHFTLDAESGELGFGDGVRGRVPPPEVVVLVAYRTTHAEVGNVRADAAWALDPEFEALNRALLGSDPAALAAALVRVANPDPASGGEPAEALGAAAARAAERLWAHERLVELCPADRCDTLDQLERSAVRARRAPERAVTALDFERLALDVPGARVRRARAWPGLDGRYACLDAPGTVTVLIVPGLPAGRPAPTTGLLRAVRAFLERRRIVCTRVVVMGPRYRVVHVAARVQAVDGADPARVQGDVVQALRTFLDPLVGGPAGLGWPFGRDVYRSEILHVIDGVPGVDHVRSLEITADAGDSGCGGVCIGPMMLAASGDHVVEVMTP